MRIFTADFETTTVETCTDETWVWVWGVAELWKENSFKYNTTIDSFMEWASKGSKIVYFHNLKFDGYFILDWLMRNGFTHNDERKAKEKTFRSLITRDGLFYEIDVCYKIHNKRIVHSIFRDSLKKLPFPVARIAKAFKLPIAKGEIDYVKVRPKGYKPTVEEIDYLFHDVEIMKKAIEIQYMEGLEKMTIGSDSLNQFKEIIGKSRFENLFPVLSSHTNKEIRKSYKGGYTYLNKKYEDKTVLKGQIYDVNSLYPAVMYDKPMPYGLPVEYKGEYDFSSPYPLYIQRLTCEFTLKKGYIPTIQIKNNFRFGANDYLESSGGEPVQLTLTSVDLKLFLEHYDVDVYSWDGGYMFKQITGLFKEYIDRFMEIKVRETGAKRELAKLLLNNLYGKFATSTDATNKIPTLEDDRIKLVLGEEQEKDSVYTAVGSFITSYAREITIRGAQALGERFIYCDTDSLHIKGYEPVKLDIDAHALGKWKFEGEFLRGRFLRAKTYIEEICIDKDGNDCRFTDKVSTKMKVTCAGMNDKVKKQVTFDNFKKGMSFEGKLLPKVIKGGVVLTNETFTIKVK